MTTETCDRCNDTLADIEDVELHNACHDYMEAISLIKPEDRIR